MTQSGAEVAGVGRVVIPEACIFKRSSELNGMQKKELISHLDARVNIP